MAGTERRLVPALSAITLRNLSEANAFDVVGRAPVIEFPTEWSAAYIDGRAAELVAQHERADFSSMSGNRLLVGEDTDDRFWFMVLAVVDGSGEARIIDRFPVAYCGSPPDSPSPNAPLAARAFFDVYRYVLAARGQRAVVGAEILIDAGRHSEALLWLLRAGLGLGQMGEDGFAQLHAMALAGMFASCPRVDAERVIAKAWAHEYPHTWGLASHSWEAIETDIAEWLMPEREQVVESAWLWRPVLFPQLNDDDASVESETTADGYEVSAAIPGGFAELTVRPYEGSSDVLTVSIDAGDDNSPRDLLAARLLAYAISEFLYPEEQLVPVLRRDRRLMLSEELSVLDLHRMVAARIPR